MTQFRCAGFELEQLVPDEWNDDSLKAMIKIRLTVRIMILNLNVNFIRDKICLIREM